MEYVDELIRRTRTPHSDWEGGCLLEQEILKFLHDEKISEEQKLKLRAEEFLESVAMLSDGYKKKIN